MAAYEHGCIERPPEPAKRLLAPQATETDLRLCLSHKRLVLTSEPLRHNTIMTLLSNFASRGSLEKSFAVLLWHMLAWRPRERITAAQALQHSCMQSQTSSKASLQQPEAPSKKIPKVLTKPSLPKTEAPSKKISHVNPDPGPAAQQNDDLSDSRQKARTLSNETDDTESIDDIEPSISEEKSPGSSSGSTRPTGAGMLAFHNQQHRLRIVGKAGNASNCRDQLLRRR